MYAAITVHRSLILPCLLSFVASCSQRPPTPDAQPLTVTFSGRGGAPSGQTTVAVVPGNPKGAIAVSLDGASYSGQWTYVAAPTGTTVDPVMTLGPGQSMGPGQSNNGLATGIAMPMTASGKIVMSGASGAWLRCAFNYSAGSTAGLGACQDDKGGEYDLQITR